MTIATASNAERLAEGVWLRLISRYAMLATPLLVAICAWLGNNYIAAQNAQFQAIALHQISQDAKISESADRILRIETDRARGITEYARWQGSITGQLEGLSKSAGELSNSMAGLKATVEGLRDRMDTQMRRQSSIERAAP